MLPYHSLKKTHLLSSILVGSLAITSLQGCKLGSDDDSDEETETVLENDESSDESSTVETDTDNDSVTDDDTTTEIVDITNAIFSERSADCATYSNDYEAYVLDIQESTDFEADVLISNDEDTCTFTSNSIPNHDFNDESANFAEGTASTAEVDLTFTVTRTPEFAATSTPLSQNIKNGIFLNGVKSPLLTEQAYRKTYNGLASFS